jgi:hypothetical protein
MLGAGLSCESNGVKELIELPSHFSVTFYSINFRS